MRALCSWKCGVCLPRLRASGTGRGDGLPTASCQLRVPADNTLKDTCSLLVGSTLVQVEVSRYVPQQLTGHRPPSPLFCLLALAESPPPQNRRPETAWRRLACVAGTGPNEVTMASIHWKMMMGEQLRE